MAHYLFSSLFVTFARSKAVKNESQMIQQVASSRPHWADGKVFPAVAAEVRRGRRHCRHSTVSKVSSSANMPLPHHHPPPTPPTPSGVKVNKPLHRFKEAPLVLQLLLSPPSCSKRLLNFIHRFLSHKRESE